MRSHGEAALCCGLDEGDQPGQAENRMVSIIPAHWAQGVVPSCSVPGPGVTQGRGSLLLPQEPGKGGRWGAGPRIDWFAIQRLTPRQTVFYLCEFTTPHYSHAVCKIWVV